MGWLRTLFLGDIGNRLDIADTERDISRLRGSLRSKRRKDASQDAAIQRLEHENDQLKLCVGSLVRLLVAKGHVSEQELVAIVDGIDDDEA